MSNELRNFGTDKELLEAQSLVLQLEECGFRFRLYNGRLEVKPIDQLPPQELEKLMVLRNAVRAVVLDGMMADYLMQCEFPKPMCCLIETNGKISAIELPKPIEPEKPSEAAKSLLVPRKITKEANLANPLF